MSLPKRLSDESGEVYWNPVQLARISGCQGMIIDSHERGHAHLVHLKLPADRSHGIQWSNNLKKNMSTSNAVWRYLAMKSEASGDIETCALASAPGFQYYKARAMRAASSRPSLKHPTGVQPQWSLASITRGDCPTLSGTVMLTEPAEEKERVGQALKIVFGAWDAKFFAWQKIA